MVHNNSLETDPRSVLKGPVLCCTLPSMNIEPLVGAGPLSLNRYACRKTSRRQTWMYLTY